MVKRFSFSQFLSQFLVVFAQMIMKFSLQFLKNYITLLRKTLTCSQVSFTT